MAEYSAPWLNKGEPIQTNDLPFAGVDAVARKRKEFSDVTSTYQRVMALYNYGIMASVLAMIEESGVEPAKEAWEQHLQEMQMTEEVREELTFDDEDFEENFRQLVDNRVKKNIEVHEDEDLGDAIERETEEALGDKTLRGLRQEMQQLEMEKALLEVFWRHRNDKHTITIPEEMDDGEVVSWEERDFNKQNLREVMTFDDWRRYQQALQENQVPDVEVEDKVDQILDPDDEDELKKSSTNS
jgi:hypothetical protein